MEKDEKILVIVPAYNEEGSVGKYGNQIRYIYKENGGQTSAFNTGFKDAEGKIITLLDADDYWSNRKLKEKAKTTLLVMKTPVWFIIRLKSLIIRANRYILSHKSKEVCLRFVRRRQ